ncbi:hypothetical protein K1719_027744 [Acacia pycnantha]|nr:hypothetical protein K1719_027744 [Acacia pycnantha]
MTMATKFEQSCNCIICCFPTVILVEIAAKVASQSLADLHHLKLTSKEIMNITEDDYVYKHASLDKVPLVLQPETIPQPQPSFLSCCRSSGNLESLYKEGTELYLCDEFLCDNDLCDDSWTLKITSWGIDSEDDDEKVHDMCENCKWDYELADFYFTIYILKHRYKP